MQNYVLYPLIMFDCSLLYFVRILHINFCSDFFTFPDPGTDIHPKIGTVMVRIKPQSESVLCEQFVYRTM